MNAIRPAGRRRYRMTTAAALALATASAVTACDRETSADQDPTGLQSMAAEAVEHGIPGIVIRVDDGDEPYAVTATADWAESVSVDDTLRVGSNSKTATAALTLQLVDEGVIELDAPVNTWLDGLPGGDTMTVRALLNHTSGLADFANEPEGISAMSGHRDEPPTDDELIAAGLTATEAAGPFDGYNYSNTGYLLLGQIIEHVSEQSVPDRFEALIAEPLGLTETWFQEPGGDDGPEMRGYEPDAEQIAALQPDAPEGFEFAGDVAADDWVDVTGIDHSWAGAAGSIISTPEEWARFQRAVLAGDLFPGELLDEMRDTVPVSDDGSDGRGYGLGLERIDTSCGVVWGHDGALPGYHADAYVDEVGERSMTVVSATNFGLARPEAGEAHDDLVDAAACAMYGKPVPGSDE